ncbi:MaoC family dehydratase N-terminal domain-containing protein [Paraburkholderia sp. D1E]|uniref:MaoC family dehydratase N-terminal domain-containing protein n=1 Tax=Paraburkholderia sp. D1E TaxID=3461398 RepID=UPI004045F345
MLDRKHIGRVVSVHSVTVEAGRLSLFIKIIGETNSVYSNEAAAKVAGYGSMPIPPTFLMCLDLERPDPFDWWREIGMDIQRVLHGEQSFIYHAPIETGDQLTFETRIEDIYEKKGGALEFVVKNTRVTNQNTLHVADMKSVIVYRNV